MCCKPFCLIFFYAVKSAGIFSWILRSLFLLHQRQDLTTIWNLFTSILMLVLDCLLHFSYLSQNCSRSLHRLFLVLFLIGIGPLLLILSLLGSVNDSIDYQDLFCEDGCTLAFVLRDLHLALLFILSIFGLAGGIIYLFVELNIENFDMVSPLIAQSRCNVEFAQIQVDCSICRDCIFVGDLVIVVESCKHLHHKECLLAWFSVKNECPICRTKVLI